MYERKEREIWKNREDGVDPSARGWVKVGKDREKEMMGMEAGRSA